MNYSFASDNTAGTHPDVLQALTQCNQEAALGYGDDQYTQKAIQLLQEKFGPRSIPYLVTNGTAANVLALQSILKSYQAILCTDIAHIHVHECGACEKFLGSKLLLLPHDNGKIRLDALKPHIDRHYDEHEVQPKVLSLTQCTEFGTVYSLEELAQIIEYVHQHGLYVHMDGARLANAAAHLGCSLKAITSDIGVDIVSFGCTKNGLMLGESVIFFDETLAESFKYIRKQGMQLISKMRFLSSQFIALLENDLWLANAQHANSMAQQLAQRCSEHADIQIKNSVQTNIIFAQLPTTLIKSLQKHFFFYIIDEKHGLVRWVTSFNTTQEQIDQFVSLLTNTN